jgi:chemotaxis response regulator CheB
MKKRRVLLVCLHPLLCDGLQRIITKMDDSEVCRLENPDLQTVYTHLENSHPDIVLLAGENEDDAATHLILAVLKWCVDIPVIWVELEANVLRLYTAHVLPANSADLISAIRYENDHEVDIHSLDIFSIENKFPQSNTGG